MRARQEVISQVVQHVLDTHGQRREYGERYHHAHGSQLLRDQIRECKLKASLHQIISNTPEPSKTSLLFLHHRDSRHRLCRPALMTHDHESVVAEKRFNKLGQASASAADCTNRQGTWDDVGFTW